MLGLLFFYGHFFKEIICDFSFVPFFSLDLKLLTDNCQFSWSSVTYRVRVVSHSIEFGIFDVELNLHFKIFPNHFLQGLIESLIFPVDFFKFFLRDLNSLLQGLNVMFEILNSFDLLIHVHAAVFKVFLIFQNVGFLVFEEIVLVVEWDLHGLELVREFGYFSFEGLRLFGGGTVVAGDILDVLLHFFLFFIELFLPLLNKVLGICNELIPFLNLLFFVLYIQLCLLDNVFFLTDSLIFLLDNLIFFVQLLF